MKVASIDPAAVQRPSLYWTAAGVVLGGVAMVAVITTEPGATSMVTSDTLTPADVAIEAAIADFAVVS